MTIHAPAARPPDWPKDRLRRISPVAAHSGDRLLSEPTAGTQPCRREPLFMPLTRRLRRARGIGRVWVASRASPL